jgi:hypothetical protein
MRLDDVLQFLNNAQQALLQIPWSDWATPLLTLGSALLIGWQIRSQTQNSKFEKQIDIIQSCFDQFEELMRVRLEIDISQESLDVIEKRRDYFYFRYWDLFFSEFEFTRAGLMPQSLFVHFCQRLRDAMTDLCEESRIRGKSLVDSWEAEGKSSLSQRSAVFCALVDAIRGASDATEVERIVRRFLKEARKDDRRTSSAMFPRIP